MRNDISKAARRNAFTLVELLVVIGIIALLISVLLPTLKRAQRSAQQVVCMSSMRQLAIAWMYYADDNKDWLVDGWPDRDPNRPPGKLPPGRRYQIPFFKGKAWGAQYGNSEAAIQEGALFKYARQTKLYHCPGDDGWHLVSVSINGWLNGEGSPGATPEIIYKRSDIKRAADIWVFIDENDWRDYQFGYNLGSFMVRRYDLHWIDAPGIWHNNGANVAFADGHVVYKHWDEKGTLKMSIPPYDFNGVGGIDLKWIQPLTAPK